MKAWVNKYIESLREEYGKGIEIKEFGKSFYVYKSTTYWIKTEKRRKKRSMYLGKLDEKRGFLKSSRKVLVQFPKFPRF